MLNNNNKTTGQRKLIPHYIDRYRYQFRFYFGFILLHIGSITGNPKQFPIGSLSCGHGWHLWYTFSQQHNMYQVANEC